VQLSLPRGSTGVPPVVLGVSPNTRAHSPTHIHYPQSTILFSHGEHRRLACRVGRPAKHSGPHSPTRIHYRCPPSSFPRGAQASRLSCWASRRTLGAICQLAFTIAAHHPLSHGEHRRLACRVGRLAKHSGPIRLLAFTIRNPPSSFPTGSTGVSPVVLGVSPKHSGPIRLLAYTIRNPPFSFPGGSTGVPPVVLGVSPNTRAHSPTRIHYRCSPSTFPTGSTGVPPVVLGVSPNTRAHSPTRIHYPQSTILFSRG
jgi:hypothetical protein